MNIGLLVTELEDQEVKRICRGAAKAAADNNVTLCIIPGKYLPKTGSSDIDEFDYQFTALFDYATSDEFDALIIDAERICSRTTILKKEAFLKKFEEKPLLTLTPQDGYSHVNQVLDDEFYFEQLGYEAVCDIIFYKKNQVLPPECEKQLFEERVSDSEKAMAALGEMSYLIFTKKYDAGEAFSFYNRIGLKNGVKTSAILLYDEMTKNTVKYPWKIPAQICIKSGVIDGDELDASQGTMLIGTDRILSTFTRGTNRTLIMGDLFISEYQLGIYIHEFMDSDLSPFFSTNLMSIITGMCRVAHLERQLKKTTDELYEVQEELARDDSVLDHIGDVDYLTGGLNRRGFFAKAYDLLKENFTEGRYAVVAYIHMESLKRINQMFGHDEGDRAVKKVAEILGEIFAGSVCGRIRGDEFAVIEIADDEGTSDTLRERMSMQNSKLLAESGRYINHLQYAICEFSYEDNLSLREMLKETDKNLRKLKGNI